MYNANEQEQEILKYWDEKNIFQKTLTKKSPKGNFVFFEGPPTANGKPGMHHVLARAFKDVVLRFRTMQGYHIERKAGWDTHGLPVELQVEKQLGISGKPEIEKYGIEEFNQKCKESVWLFKGEWEKLTRRIAFWLDMDKPYITYENNYIESLWWILKKVNERGLLYRGYKVVPQCPRCGTALSSHEVAQGYKSVKENSIYIKFKVKNQKDTYILSWTTTPWTLPGNIALAIGEDINYVKVRQESTYYILAESLVENVLGESVEIVEKMIGADLIGLEYEPLFVGAIDSGDKKAWFVGKAKFVTTADGTGVVHTAAMYGEDDYNFGLENNLPLIHTVDESGKFLPSVKQWAGRFVKDKKVEEEIIADLRDRGLLLKEKMYEHDYPFCWRCDSPLLYYAKNSWFIQMSKLKEQMLKNNAQINWVPEYIKDGRFGEWLENIKDWAISRERYWGTPIPIWQCDKCDKFEVIGSFEELKNKTGKMPQNTSGEPDVHRPFVDDLKYQCDCGGKMVKIKEVFDCWFDSGAMPFAQHHYPFENKSLIDNGSQFPAEYISEAIDQTRGWFYTLLAVSTLLDKGACYKNVICLGHIRDKEGKKMSKSKGNIVDPWMIAEKYGVDAMRMFLYSLNQPGEPKNFDEKDVQETLRKVVMLLSNVVSFYQLYADGHLSGVALAKTDENIKTLKHESIKTLEHKNSSALDGWLLAKLNLLIKEVTGDMEKYHVYEASRKLIEFINELSTWYVRRSRDRFKSGDEEDKQAALATLGETLNKLLKLLAPFAPFISEKLYQDINGILVPTQSGDSNIFESIHLAEWPSFDNIAIDDGVLSIMASARKIVEMGLALRAEKNIKVRQPLEKLFVMNLSLPEEYARIVCEELNIKKIEFVSTVPADENIVVKTDGELSVGLFLTISEELKEEGLMRELIRTINQIRKEQKLTIQDKVKISLSTDSDALSQVIKNKRAQIGAAVLAEEIIFSNAIVGGSEIKIDGESLLLKVERVGNVIIP